MSMMIHRCIFCNDHLSIDDEKNCHEKCRLIYDKEIRIAELEAKLAEREWQDISTAPKDGAKVIIYDTKHGVRSGSWIVGINFTGWNHSETPTHWQPLPPKPESEQT